MVGFSNCFFLEVACFDFEAFAGFEDDEHIALGFDFMDYIPGMEDSNVVGMKDITEIQNIALKLKKNEFTDEEINAICFNNAYSFMQNYL